MTLDGHNKLIAAGFKIIRKRDFPKPEIWYKDVLTGGGGWHKVKQFPSKAARDRKFKELLQDSYIVED